MSRQRRCPTCGRRLAGKRRYCDAGCARDHARSRHIERAAEARADFDPATSGYELTAEHAGTCPLCAGFIVPGRSRIVALATPTFCVRPEFDRDGNPKRRRRRTWVHVNCLEAEISSNPAPQGENIRV